MYVIQVSSAYASVLHGSWADKGLAERTAEQCARCARSGGELSENGCPICGPDAEIRWLPELEEAGRG